MFLEYSVAIHQLLELINTVREPYTNLALEYQQGQERVLAYRKISFLACKLTGSELLDNK